MKWKNKISLKEEFDKYADGEMTSKEVLIVLNEKLKGIHIEPDKWLSEIIENIDDAIMYEDIDEDVFNHYLSEIYDWGDHHQRLWITTF